MSLLTGDNSHSNVAPQVDPKAAYRAAGVNLEAGQAAVSIAKQAAHATKLPFLPMLSGVGSFSAAFQLPSGWNNPVLLTACDGVGTKLLLAHQLNRFDTVGIDLVAMNANDILANGGQPLVFMDYIATGQLETHQFEALLTSIALGCQQAGCQLIGGETAEMPGLYAPGHVDVAGFCMGLAEQDTLYPKMAKLSSGNIVIGLASSGCHSNGYSLIRKLLAEHQVDLSKILSNTSQSVGEALLEPTKIYVKPVLEALKTHPDAIHAMAHITGGGFAENIPRVLPNHLAVELDSWALPPLYQWLAHTGKLDWDTLTHTFNAGIGFVLVVEAHQAHDICDTLKHLDESLSPQIIGEIIPKEANQPNVIWN